MSRLGRVRTQAERHGGRGSGLGSGGLSAGVVGGDGPVAVGDPRVRLGHGSVKSVDYTY